MLKESDVSQSMYSKVYRLPAQDKAELRAKIKDMWLFFDSITKTLRLKEEGLEDADALEAIADYTPAPIMQRIYELTPIEVAAIRADFKAREGGNTIWPRIRAFALKQGLDVDEAWDLARKQGVEF